MTAHIASNTDKVYPCINCGSKQSNIIREGAALESTKLKCSICGFLYTASDSKDLEEKGQVPDGPPTVQEPVHTSSEERGDVAEEEGNKARSSELALQAGTTKNALPRTPAFVFISKDRSRSQFCSRREFKNVLLTWEYMKEKYDVYELHSKKVSTKIDIQ